MKIYITTLIFLLATANCYATDLERLIDIHISEYESAYPDMDIVRLYHQSGMNYSQLKSLLGESPENIDYDHPEDVKALLVEAQLDRIESLARDGMPSSTIFRRNNRNHPYICIITLDPQIYNSGVYSATRFMFDLEEHQYKTIKQKYILSNKKFIYYALDHEIFHCIYSRVNGYTYPKTKSLTKSLYDRYHVEMLADLYAIMSHRHRYPGDEDFITSIRHAKTLNLLNWDITHYTAGMSSSRQLPPNHNIIASRVSIVINQGSILIPDYEHFKHEMISAFSIIKADYDSSFTLPSDMYELDSVLLDPEIHESMLKEIRNTIYDLFSH